MNKLQSLIMKSKAQSCSEIIEEEEEYRYPIIKVSDFGISGVSDKYNSEIDTGTLKYMAPEVLAKK